MSESKILPYAKAIIKLLQGIVYDDDVDTWKMVVEYSNDITKHFQGIGVEVLLDPTEGYCFLRQKKFSEEEPEGIILPNLVDKRQLTYPITVLIVLLREKLLKLDASGTDTRLILDRSDIYNMLGTFLPQESNEAKAQEKIDGYINKLIEYHFLRKLNNDESKVEVRRIIKAKILAEALTDIINRLKEYARKLV